MGVTAGGFRAGGRRGERTTWWGAACGDPAAGLARDRAWAEKRLGEGSLGIRKWAQDQMRAGVINADSNLWRRGRCRSLGIGFEEGEKIGALELGKPVDEGAGDFYPQKDSLSCMGKRLGKEWARRNLEPGGGECANVAWTRGLAGCSERRKDLWVLG